MTDSRREALAYGICSVNDMHATVLDMGDYIHNLTICIKALDNPELYELLEQIVAAKRTLDRCVDQAHKVLYEEEAKDLP